MSEITAAICAKDGVDLDSDVVCCDIVAVVDDEDNDDEEEEEEVAASSDSSSMSKIESDVATAEVLLRRSSCSFCCLRATLRAPRKYILCMLTKSGVSCSAMLFPLE